MLKTRKKSISLMIVMAFLLSIMIPAAAFADTGILNVSNALAQNVKDDFTAQTLGWVKVTIDEDDVATGTLYVDVELPDEVEFATSGDDSASLQFNVTPVVGSNFVQQIKFDGTAGNFEQVKIKEEADDQINVDVTVRYVDASNFKLDEFEQALTLGTKGDAEVTVTAGDPKSVTLGDGKSIAKITLEENFAGALENGSKVVFSLPDDFKWDNSGGLAWVTAGSYGLNGTLAVNVDKDELTLTITSPSTALEDELEIKGFINVYPDAAEGDIQIEVYDNSTGCDSNIDDTDLVVAIYGDSDVDVTADDDTGDDYMYIADENQTLWTITLESSGTFTLGDDLFLTLPDGAEFMNAMDTAAFTGFTNNGLFNDKQSLWLQINAAGAAKDELDIAGLTVGLTPEVEAGDFVVEFTGDVVETDVVASEVFDRVTVSADEAAVEVGLNQAAGNITIVESKKKALANGEEIFIALPNGVIFASTPTVEVNGEELNGVTIKPAGFTDEDVCKITLAELRTNQADTILISDIEFDIDARYTVGSEITVKIGGKDATNDDLNQLVGGGQFDDEADDAVTTVVNAVLASPTASEAVLVIGESAITINGEEQTMDVAPYIKDSRTFVPIRYAANAVGVANANIIWDDVAKKATIIKGDRVAQFTIGSNEMLLNGATITMDVAPEITNGRTMIPLRALGQALGASFGWDDATKTVTIEVD